MVGEGARTIASSGMDGWGLRSDNINSRSGKKYFLTGGRENLFSMKSCWVVTCFRHAT